jgi:hypothetical protein
MPRGDRSASKPDCACGHPPDEHDVYIDVVHGPGPDQETVGLTVVRCKACETNCILPN